MSKVETTKIKKDLDNEKLTDACEQQLATDLELISLLRENPDILLRHQELLAVLQVPHQAGKAVSLIERQVGVLREQAQSQENRLRELMDVARDNERLAESRHRLAVNLLAAHDLDDVISTVLDILSNELAADHAVIKLFTDNEEQISQSAGLFVNTGEQALSAFKTMLEHKNTVCGKSTAEQKAFLFDADADDIKSVAIIPLVAGANLGLIGLGANDAERFSASMGIDFLSQVGDLISAALAVHMEN